jgi:hypothetical protein
VSACGPLLSSSVSSSRSRSVFSSISLLFLSLSASLSARSLFLSRSPSILSLFSFSHLPLLLRESRFPWQRGHVLFEIVKRGEEVLHVWPQTLKGNLSAARHNDTRLADHLLAARRLWRRKRGRETDVSGYIFFYPFSRP